MGMQIYLRYCAQCHGEKGMGDGPNVKAAGMDPVPRDLCDIKKPYMKNNFNNNNNNNLYKIKFINPKIQKIAVKIHIF